MLNHTSGLHNALADIGRGNPFLMANWEQCLKSIVMSEPETEPGQEQTYHYLSYGYICGGIIEVIHCLVAANEFLIIIYTFFLYGVGILCSCHCEFVHAFG